MKNPYLSRLTRMSTSLMLAFFVFSTASALGDPCGPYTVLPINNQGKITGNPQNPAKFRFSNSSAEIWQCTSIVKDECTDSWTGDQTGVWKIIEHCDYDSDGDGVFDGDDNCKKISNPANPDTGEQ